MAHCILYIGANLRWDAYAFRWVGPRIIARVNETLRRFQIVNNTLGSYDPHLEEEKMKQIFPNTLIETHMQYLAGRVTKIVIFTQQHFALIHQAKALV